MITVRGQVDREKGDFYTLTVVADDGGPKIDSTVVSSFFQLLQHLLSTSDPLLSHLWHGTACPS